MKYIFLFFLIAYLYSCDQAKTNSENKQTDSTGIISQLNENLLTDTGFGKITKTTTYTDLINLFGKANLLDTISYAPEGLDSFMVTKIYANTPRDAGESIMGDQELNTDLPKVKPNLKKLYISSSHFHLIINPDSCGKC